MPATGLGVKAFDHLTLIVNDLEASREFYVDWLGMAEVPRPGFSFSGKWFQLGGVQIHLIEAHDQSSPAGFDGKNPPAETRCLHFAFSVDDAVAGHEFLRERGVTIIAGPKHRPDGAVQVFVADPDGHRVELCQAPDDE